MKHVCKVSYKFHKSAPSSFIFENEEVGMRFLEWLKSNYRDALDYIDIGLEFVITNKDELTLAMRIVEHIDAPISLSKEVSNDSSKND